jgi:hypothetical protein
VRLVVPIVLAACSEGSSSCPSSVEDYCATSTKNCPLTWTAANDARSWNCAEWWINYWLTMCNNVLVASFASDFYGTRYSYSSASGALYGIDEWSDVPPGCSVGGPAPRCDVVLATSNPCPPPPVVTCDVLAQTGCMTGQKCSWIDDSATAGHIGCAPDGTVALGGACAHGAFGATGYDNCMKGTVCIAGHCDTICSNTPPFAGVCPSTSRTNTGERQP